MSRSGLGLSWGGAPAPLRALARWITIVQLVGYTASLLFVHHTTGMRPDGITARYRGDEAGAGGDPMQFRKSLTEMLSITHTHLFSMAVIFVLSGAALAFCERPSPRARRWLITEPFVALLVSFGAMWLMWGVDARFGWLLMASSTLMALTFYLQAFYILRELGWRDAG